MAVKKVAIKILIIIMCILLLMFNVSIFSKNTSDSKKMYILSTRETENNYELPGYNWGECIDIFMNTENIDVINVDIAVDFETFDFISFDKQLNKNDYVLIQLGNIYSQATSENYKRIEKIPDIYSEWIKDIRNKNAVPIIITPNCANYDESSPMYKYYNECSDISVKWAEENDVPVVDLTQMLYGVFNAIERNNGKHIVDTFFVIDKHSENYINRFVFNYCGAVFVSGFVAETLRDNVSVVSEHIMPKFSEDDFPKISRGEFVRQILELADNVTINESDDINDKDYYMKMGRDIGIVFGGDDGNFYTDKEIEIGEACAIADRLLQINGIILEKEEASSFWLGLYGVNDYAMDSVRRFYSVVYTGLNYDGFYLTSIYGIYDILYNELN